jgi:hypothetical protein
MDNLRSSHEDIPRSCAPLVGVILFGAVREDMEVKGVLGGVCTTFLYDNVKQGSVWDFVHGIEVAPCENSLLKLMASFLGAVARCMRRGRRAPTVCFCFFGSHV